MTRSIPSRADEDANGQLGSGNPFPKVAGCGGDLRSSLMPIDYRSEMKRPVSLALGALAVLGWILAGVIAIHQARKADERHHEIRQLTVSQNSARAEAEQLRRANGNLAELQSRIAAAQQQ